MTPEAKALITGAVETLTERGWCQKLIQDNEGRCCILGAMDVVYHQGASYKSGTWEEAKQLISEAIASNGYPYYLFTSDTIIKFNDAPGRTKEEVLELLSGIVESE